ncbi:MarR family winged helix-turn-helix transcriptional regulator [Aquibium sp. ELW1220]|uniref:MarR family winged helix-turn-helix transcriptional regulator n=1 Tax=Aquibium sp. ELW1220 TaxID=2976766 RepID=UPI0025AF8FA2|nr:MarR family winged helix-turn-helix transcriptional regulator [Aquibium sp. ELW1220]MDN2579355.1 MarR family winged helix-turn-helix transcriptional regulator [Aquibium sp. ELW1220]
MSDELANVPEQEGFHPQQDLGGEFRTLMKAVRRIVRANDVRSRALARASGLTAPQLAVLTGVVELGEVTTNALSDYADLSPATVVMILENLEGRAIVERYRSTTDRRVVYTRLTEKGRTMVTSAPLSFGEAFAGRYAALPAEKRRVILEGLTETARLMERQ